MSERSSVETVKLDIIVKAGSSAKELNEVTSSLDELDNALGKFNIKNIDNISKKLNTFGTSFSKQMESAIEMFSEFTESIDNVNSALNNMAEGIASLESLEVSINLKDAAEEVKTESETIEGAFDTLVATFQRPIDLTGNEKLSKSFKRMTGIASFLFDGLTMLIGGIFDLATNWDTMTPDERVIGVLKALAGAIMVVVGTYLAWKAVATMGVAIPAIVAGLAIGAAAIGIFASQTGKSSQELESYAKGGSFSTADLFYANEDGNTELVASSNTGGGAVMNMEQLRSAVYDGVSAAMSKQDSSGAGGDVYLDGKKVGKIVTQGVYAEGTRVGFWR